MNKYFKIGFVIFVIVILIYFFSNIYFGWYGYEKWKYRRSTRGNIIESKERNIYVKKLRYIVNPQNLKYKFNCYIEKGYTFGHYSMYDTQVVTNTKFPFQVSVSQLDTINDIYFSINKKSKVDSMDSYVVYLNKNYLKDTIYVDVIKNNTDTIGKIKVFE